MKLDIDNEVLTVKLNLLETILSFRGSLNIPLERISDVSTDKPGWKWGARAPGIHIPFLVKMGTFLVSSGREFWSTTIGKPYLVLDTEGWNYSRIVLTTDRNKEWAERIRQAVQTAK